MRVAVLLPAAILSVALCAAIARGGEGGWKVYHTTADGGKLSYDTGSVVERDHVTEVWSRFEPAGPGPVKELRNYVRFDCTRGRWKVLKRVTEKSDGSREERTLRSRFEAVDAEGNSGFLFREVCTGSR